LEKDILFGSWKARSLYRTVLFVTVARELVRHKLYLVGVQEVGWDKGGIARAGYIFFYRKQNENNQLGTGFLIH
jgi:hypothetical protein